MTVSELFRSLMTLPPDAEVGIVYDGAIRTEAEYVWLAQCGQVAVSPDEPVYHDEDRPHGAPSSETDRYWRPGK